MNQSRDQFLARAAFSGEQHRGVAEERYFDDLAQSRNPSRAPPGKFVTHGRRLEQLVDACIALEARRHRRPRIGTGIPCKDIRCAGIEQPPVRTRAERFAAQRQREHTIEAVLAVAIERLAQLVIHAAEKDDPSARAAVFRHRLQFDAAAANGFDHGFRFDRAFDSMRAVPSKRIHGEEAEH
jgi:hypothetical protein